MSVHLKIAEQVKNHREAQKQFLALDTAREVAIQHVLNQAKEGEPIQITEINRLTNKMNQIATVYQFPPRKLVTAEMIETLLSK